MAQLQLQPVNKGKRNQNQSALLRIDMTPMVDLGFLLITFFIFTTTMAEQKGTDLFMPKDGPPSKIGESTAMTVLLGGSDSIYAYSGSWKNAMANNQVVLTNYSTQNGLGKLIRSQQSRLGNKREDLMVLIKPLENSSYNNIINVLDEILINDVKRYAIVNVTDSETQFLQHSYQKRN